MHAEIVNIVLAFIEGFALIISPCILPILPIVLSGSLTGSKARPLGIIVGFILTFTVVTLFSKALVLHTHINVDVMRNVSFILLLLLGVMMVSTRLTEAFTLFTQRLTRVGSRWSLVNNAQGGFWGGFLLGGLVGIIWTPCAGPILAAVIVQVVLQRTTAASLLTVMAFGIGAGVPMLLIALIGRGIMRRFAFFRNQAVHLRQLLGVIIILTVLYLFYDANTSFSYSAPAKLQSKRTTTTLIDKLEHPYPAPAINGIDAWINSPPLTLNALKGKVVLIDFWTYSCINCLRTLPYLKEWYAKYHAQGLEIIGVHSPEFEFEHNLDNVNMAVAKYAIPYPVALDNHFVTWQNYKNEYWPAHYLINQQGEVVYEHFGEGEYDVTENNIRYLLGLNNLPPLRAAEMRYAYSQTPETYLGYSRADHFANTETVVTDQMAAYQFPAQLGPDQWALNGQWVIQSDKIVSAAPGASIKLNFNAAKVYAVMGLSGLKGIHVSVMVDGKVPTDAKGHDVVNGVVEVKQHQLYDLLDYKAITNGEVELTADAAGLEIYTFTFGE